MQEEEHEMVIEDEITQLLRKKIENFADMNPDIQGFLVKIALGFCNTQQVETTNNQPHTTPDVLSGTKIALSAERMGIDLELLIKIMEVGIVKGHSDALSKAGRLW